MIKLIAVDLDGTLLTTKKQIDPRTTRTLRAAAQSGCQLVFCTGRSCNELTEILPVLPFFRYAILCNGAYVVELPDAASLHTAPLEAADVRTIHNALSGFDMLFELCHHDRTLSPRAQLARVREFGVTDLAELVLSSRTPVDDLVAFLAAQTEPIGKINIFFRSTQQRNRALQITAPLPYTSCFQEPTNLEFNRSGVNKGTGLRWLAVHLGIDASEVAAIGDNNNDLPMLRCAGTAVAMGNAIKTVREAAAFVTAGNDDGVGRAVARLLGFSAPHYV